MYNFECLQYTMAPPTTSTSEVYEAHCDQIGQSPMSFHQQSPGPSTSGTLSSGQPTPAPQQPSPSADVPQGNGTKVITMLLERLANIGKWKVELIRNTLKATIQNATRMEVENLWLATYFRKKGDPPSVDVGHRRPHSDRQPATPEEMASAQEFFEAVMSELNREMDRRGWFTLMSCTEAQAQAKARSTSRRLSTTEIIAMATHFAPDGYNGGFEFLKDPNSGDVAEAAAVEGQNSFPTSSTAAGPGENSSSGSPPIPGIPSVDQHSEPDDRESDLETVLGDDETYNPGAAVIPNIDMDDGREDNIIEDPVLGDVAEAAEVEGREDEDEEDVPEPGQKWWPDDHNSDRTTVLGDGRDDMSDFDDEGEDDFFEDPDAGDAAEAVEDENEDEVDAPEQHPNVDAPEASFNFNDLQRSIDSEGMNEIPRGSGGLEDGLRPADTSGAYDLQQDHREVNVADQEAEGIPREVNEHISEANQLENEAPAEVSNGVISNVQGVEEEGLEELAERFITAHTLETGGSDDVLPAHNQDEVVEDAPEGSLDRPEQHPNDEEDAPEESFNFNDLQRSIDSEGMNEIPRGSGGLEDGLRPADTSRSYDLHQDHREDNLVNQADKEAEPISEANQMENEDEDETPAEASNDVTSNAQGVEEEGQDGPEESVITLETSEQPEESEGGSDDVHQENNQGELVKNAPEGSLGHAHAEEISKIIMDEAGDNTNGVEERDENEHLPDQEMFAEENDLGDEEEVEIIPGNSEMSSEEAPEEVAKSPEASADPIDVDPPAENGGERAEDMDLEEEVMFGEASTFEPTGDDMESSAAARSNPPDNGQAEPSNVVSGEDVEATGTPEGPVEEEDQTMEQDDVEMLEENSGGSEDDGNQYEGVEEAPEEAFSLARTLDNSEATELSGNNDADQRTGGAPLDRGNVDENHPSGQSTAARHRPSHVPDTPTEMIRALLEGINNVGRLHVEHMTATLLDDVSQADTEELQQLWSITDSRKQGNRAPIDAGEYLKFPDHLPSTTEELERAEVFYEVVLSVVLEELNRRKSSEVQSVEDEAREVENHQQPIAEKDTENLEQGIDEDNHSNDGNQQFEDTDAAPEESLNSAESQEEVPADAERENPEKAPEQGDAPEEHDPEDLEQGVEEQENANIPVRRYTNDPADLPMEAWRRMSDGSYANVRTQARFRTIPTVAEMEVLRNDSDDFVYPPDSSEDDDDDEEIDSRSNHQEAQDSEQLERIGRIDEDDHEDPYDGLLVDPASSATSSPDHQGNQVDDMQDDVSFAYDEDEYDSETGFREPSRQARPSQSYAPRQDHREDNGRDAEDEQEHHRRAGNPEQARSIRMDRDQEMRVTYYDYDENVVYGENGNEVREPSPSRRFRRGSEDRKEDKDEDEDDAQIWTLEEEQKVMRDIWELDEKERRGEDMSGNLPVEEIHENLEDDPVRNVENALGENREEEQEATLQEERQGSDRRSRTSSPVSFMGNGEDAPGENGDEEQEAALQGERQGSDRRSRTSSPVSFMGNGEDAPGENGDEEQEATLQEERQGSDRRSRTSSPEKSEPSRRGREGEEGEREKEDEEEPKPQPSRRGRGRPPKKRKTEKSSNNDKESARREAEADEEKGGVEEVQEQRRPYRRGIQKRPANDQPTGRMNPPKKQKTEKSSNNDKEPLNKGVEDEEGDVEEVQEEPRRSSRRGKRAATDQPTSKRNPPKKRKTEDSSNKDKEPLKKGAEDEEGDVEEVQEEPRSSRRGRRSSTNQRKGRRNPPKERKIEKSSNDDHQSGPSRKVREGEEGESLEDDPARNVEDAPGENGEKEQEITLEDDRNRQSRTSSPKKSEPSKRVREGEGEGEKEDEEEPKPKRGRGRPPKKRKAENLSNNDDQPGPSRQVRRKEEDEEVKQKEPRLSRTCKRTATDQPDGRENSSKKRKTEKPSNNAPENRSELLFWNWMDSSVISGQWPEPHLVPEN
ncbi:hypothetical protein B9Z55_028286 [Caenorhabditis nigoni]|uniref:Uncharacterized protein n=2 Tax=Caenorhabditis nigoni TaxID=1611254 RepID=A0A2G5SCJ0_9PELO|nr:hypothetical protein B9Z55_028286 [Caenorhabditis nigoni]